jgi:hypothetical protein
MGFIDYMRKVGYFVPTLIPAGNIDHAFEKIRAFYDTIIGKIPEKSTPADIAPQGG